MFALFTSIYRWLASDIGLSVFLASFVVTICLYAFLYLWIKKVTDPVIPIDEPPENMSPYQMGYHYSRYYAAQLLSSTFVDMEQRGYIQIEYTGFHMWPKFSIIKRSIPKQKICCQEYNNLYSWLYTIKQIPDKLSINKKSKIILKQLQDVIHPSYGALEHYLIHNSLFKWFPVMCSSLMFILAMYFGFDPKANEFNMFLTFTLLVINVYMPVGLVRYNEQGKLLLHQIASFRLFLKGKHSLSLPKDPDKARQLFVKYLPYAICLGVVNYWAKQFDDILKAQDIDKDAAADLTLRKYVSRYAQLTAAITQATASDWYLTYMFNRK